MPVINIIILVISLLFTLTIFLCGLGGYLQYRQTQTLDNIDYKAIDRGNISGLR